MSTMTLFLKLDKEIWTKGDFGLSTGLGLTGTIYTTSQLITPQSLTGYTLKIRFYDQLGDEVFNDDCNILDASLGTWEYLPDDGDLNFDFIGEVRIELNKSTQQITAIGVNGSAGFRIR